MMKKLSGPKTALIQALLASVLLQAGMTAQAASAPSVSDTGARPPFTCTISPGLGTLLRSWGLR